MRQSANIASYSWGIYIRGGGRIPAAASFYVLGGCKSILLQPPFSNFQAFLYIAAILWRRGMRLAGCSLMSVRGTETRCGRSGSALTGKLDSNCRKSEGQAVRMPLNSPQRFPAHISLNRPDRQDFPAIITQSAARVQGQSHRLPQVPAGCKAPLRHLKSPILFESIHPEKAAQSKGLLSCVCIRGTLLHASGRRSERRCQTIGYLFHNKSVSQRISFETRRIFYQYHRN